MTNQGAGEDRGLVVRLGPLTVDIPRSLGYYGAIGLAVGAGVIEPPLGVFIAAVPVLKMMTNRLATTPVRFVGQMFDGAAQPVGGDGQGTIRLETAAVNRADAPGTTTRRTGSTSNSRSRGRTSNAATRRGSSRTAS